MATNSRPTRPIIKNKAGKLAPATVFDHLMAKPTRYSFHQCVRILHNLNPSNLIKQGLNVRFNCALNFTPKVYEINKITINGNNAIVDTNLMTLTGIDGPLPIVYSEDFARQRPPNRAPILAFLDLFSNRLLQIKYSIALKYWPGLGDFNSDNIFYILRSFSGFYDEKTLQTNNSLCLYAAYIFMNPKNCTNLAYFINNVYGARVEINEYYGQWYPLEEQFILGKTKLLSPVLGSYVWLQNAKIKITLFFKQVDWILKLYLNADIHNNLTRELNYLLNTNTSYKMDIYLENGIKYAPKLGQSTILGVLTQL